MLTGLQISSCRSRTHSCAGWTLLEMMVGSLAGSIILAAILVATVFSSKSFIAIGNYIDLNDASRVTLDYMSRDIRNAAAVVSYATNAITLSNQDGTQFTYAWNPSTSLVTRTDNSGTKTFLQDCDFLTFYVFQRNPTNDLQFVPASTASEAKLVDVSWRCSRKIFGVKINTESVQTAEIVIRN